MSLLRGESLNRQGVTLLAKTASKTTAYTAAPGELVIADTTAGPFAITLPAAPTSGDPIQVGVRWDAGPVPPVVQAAGADLIGSGTSTTAADLAAGETRCWQSEPGGGRWRGLYDNRPAITGQQFGLIDKLLRNALDATMVVVGDSTGDPNTNAAAWPLKIAQRLAARFPAYTVKYAAINTSTLIYPTPTTIQTGTGTHILTIYNGSVSGTDVAHVAANRTALIPSTPDLIVINHGHNGSNTMVNYRLNYFQMIRTLQNFYPAVDIACILQNPRNDANAEAHRGRMSVISGIARDRGLAVIDVWQAWVDDGRSFATLLQDAIHPNAVGQDIFAAEIDAHLGSRPNRGRLYGPVDPPHRVWVQAGSMVAGTGSPALSFDNTLCAPVYSLPAHVDAEVGLSIDWPSTWQSTHIWVVWSLGTTDAGNVCWNRGRSYIGADVSGVAPQTAAISNLGGTATQTTTAGGTANRTFFTLLEAGVNYNNRPLGYRLRRVGTDVNDTITVPVKLLGLMLERVG